MPKPRDGSNQHNIDLHHYGSLPVEMMPDGEQSYGFWMWDGFQWQHIRIIGGGGLDVSYDPDAKTLEIALTGIRQYFDFDGDAVILKTALAAFTADAVLA